MNVLNSSDILEWFELRENLYQLIAKLDQETPNPYTIF